MKVSSYNTLCLLVCLSPSLSLDSRAETWPWEFWLESTVRARWRLKPHEASEGYGVKMGVLKKKRKEKSVLLLKIWLQYSAQKTLPAIIGCALNLCVLGSSTATLISIQAFFSRDFVVGARAI